MIHKICQLILVVCSLLGSMAHGQVTVNSEPHGVFTLVAPANTDTVIAPPFGRPAAWRGRLSAVTANGVFTVTGTPGWTVNQFTPAAEVYYLRIISGVLAGNFFTISSNSGNTVATDLAGLSIVGLLDGDQAEVAPYWTLGTFYPGNMVNSSYVPSASALVRQTEILIYDPAGTGINRSPSETYYYYNGAWRKVGSSVATSFNSRVILPDTYFIHRNKAAATKITTQGRMFTSKLATVIEGRAGNKQDNFVAVPYPGTLSLRQTGLATGGAFAASTSSLVRKDELLVFDQQQTGINRSPSSTYYFYNNGWRKLGAAVGTDFSDTVTLPAGSGFIIRKAPGAAAAYWTFDTTY